MNINNWLKEIGLQEYSKLFENKNVTWSELTKVTTTNELKELGIASSIIRDKLLFEITNLSSRKVMGKAPSPPTEKPKRSKSTKLGSVEEIKRIYPSQKKVLNEYEEAIIKDKKELKTKIKELGEEHPDVGDLYYEIGTNYYMNNEYKKAISNHKKSLAIRIKNYGEDDVDVVISYYQLGQDYYMDSEYELAITHHSKALKLQQELNEDDDHNEGVAAISFDLAKDYYYDCQYDKAIIHYENSLDIRKYIHGDIHTSVAEVYHNLGLVYQQKSQYKKALPNFKTALDIYTEVEGEYSEDALKMENLAIDTQAEIDSLTNSEVINPTSKPDDSQDNYDEIKTEVDEVIASGDTCIEIKDFAEALRTYSYALKLCEQMFDSDEKTETIATINFKLGTTSKTLEEYTEAEKYLEESIDGFVSIHGQDYFDTARSYSQLGDVMYHQDNYEDAIRYHQKALISYSNIDEKELSAWSHYDLGLDYYWLEEYDQSVDHFSQALDIRLELYGLENASVANCYNRLGLSYYWDNKLDLAIKNHKIAMEIREKLFGQGSEEFDDSRYSIAQSYYYDGQMSLAKEHFSESLSYRKRKFGLKSNEYKKAKEWLDKIR